MHAIYRILKESSILISPGRTSRITSGTFSEVLRSLKVEGRDFLDALPTAESLYSASALGAHSAWGLGYPADWDSFELASASLKFEDAIQPNCARWYDRDILGLNETNSPFCCEPGLSGKDFFYRFSDNRSRWAIFAYWKDMSRNRQNHLLSLCASTMSLVASIAVCEDSNWASVTAGWFAHNSSIDTF